MTRHVFLVGMPGSGKSCLGRRAAARLHVPYADTDARIEEAAGCRVKEIFERWGEAAFRQAETNLLITMAGEEPALVSTGGGMLTRPENLRMIKGFGYVVLIDRPLTEIEKSIRLEKRPLLAQKGPDELRRLYAERIGLYREAADAVLDNSRGFQQGLLGLEAILRGFFPGLGR